MNIAEFLKTDFFTEHLCWLFMYDEASLKDMQQVYRRTPMLKCDFNKNAATLLKSHLSMGAIL